MANRFLISAAAAALLAGTSFANAQGTMGHEGPAAEHAATPNAEHAAPGGGPAMRSNEKMQPPGGAAQHAQEGMTAPKGERSAQENNMKGEKSEHTKGMNAQTEEKGAAGKDMKAEGRENQKSEGRENHMNADSTRNGAESKTVGQAGAGAKLSTEQRTKISSVIRDQHVESITNVNFAVSVGTRVPRDVSFHPLPPEVVTYYPEWRGYEFILVRGQIVVVDPQTYEIVAVLDA